MKPLAITLSGAERGSKRRNGGDDLTNMQYKPIWNCHSESSLYSEYILMKKKRKLRGMKIIHDTITWI
jgi:hypothetical protein